VFLPGKKAMAPMQPNKIHTHRFVIVAGKGGVGKSTIAMSIALAAARSGRKTLLFQFGGQELRPLPFGNAQVGTEIVELAKNLYAVRPTTTSGMREYALLKLKSRTAYKLVFENDFVQKLIHGIPGVNELIWLGKAFNHERERDKDGRALWDTIVLDPPATGHSLTLLQVPFVVRDAVPTGPFHREAEDTVRLLQDPLRTAVVLVTLAEEMPVNESIQLRMELEKRMRIPVAALCINGLFPNRFAGQEALVQRIQILLEEEDDVLERLATAACFRLDRRQLQQSYVQRLDQVLQLPTLEIPFYFREDIREDVIVDIAQRVAEFTLTRAKTTMWQERQHAEG